MHGRISSIVDTDALIHCRNEVSPPEGHYPQGSEVMQWSVHDAKWHTLQCCFHRFIIITAPLSTQALWSQSVLCCVFDCITVFKALYLQISAKSRVCTQYIITSIALAFTQCVWAPLLTEITHFECSDATEMRNRILFDFYMGLPNVYACKLQNAHCYICHVV